MVPDKIGYYTITEKLGKGGMGEVYLAEDTRLNRKVAIKLIPEELEANEQARKRLVREARAVATLDHPNICSIYEVISCEGANFIVMQYVEGETVSERSFRKRFDVDECLQIGIQVADALSEAHSHRIIHRDLKPQNIMITARGHVKLLDFGLAKMYSRKLSSDSIAATQSLLSEPWMVVGTIAYMSPEQVRGEEVDGRSDIFSLGVVLYELLTGRRPFSNGSTAAIVSEILTREPPPLARYVDDAPQELQRIISKALCKAVDGRYQTAKDLQVDLKNLMGERAFEEKLERSFSGDAAMATASLRKSTWSSRLAPDVPPFSNRKASKGRLALFVTAGAALLAVAVVLSYYFIASAGDSLAVLPFTYRSDQKNMPDIDSEYLSDGITESLIDSLSKLPKVKVIARSSVFRYKGKDIDPQAVGRELGVSKVLVGKITQHGDLLTISPELIEVSDNRHIWGAPFDRKVTGLLEAQGAIAREISENLRVKFTGGELQLLNSNLTNDAEAYQAYLKGRYYWNKRTEEGFKKAIEFFDQAIAKDPKYAIAYTGKADAYMLLSDYGYIPPAQGYPRATDAVMAALKINDALAEAHTSLGGIKMGFEWDWPGAEREYKKALDLNPNYITAHHWYALYLSLVGRADEAVAEIKKAQQIDPLSIAISKDYGIILYYARRYEEALDQLRRGLDIDPEFAPLKTQIAQVQLQQAKYQEAIVQLERLHAVTPEDPEIAAVLGDAYVGAGRRPEALKLLEHVTDSPSATRFVPKQLAILYWRLGDADHAIAVLRTAIDGHYYTASEIKVDPGFDGLRADQRFSDLLGRINLPQ
jgi:serine/threonine-protein kinase